MSDVTLLRNAPVHVISENGGYAGGPEASIVQTSLLELVWRHRWLVVLCIGLGALGAFVYLQRATPLYTSTSRVYVERNLPRILEGPLQVGHTASYLHTQAELISSTPVLASAVHLLGGSRVTAFQSVSNPTALLKTLIQVSVGQDDEIINVSIDLPDPDEAARVVNSVVDAYISRYAEDKSATAADVLEILRSQKERSDQELDQWRRAMQEFRTANPDFTLADESGNIVTRRLVHLTDELNRTEILLLDAKTSWERLRSIQISNNSRMTGVPGAIGSENDVPSELEKQINAIEFRLDTLRSSPLSPRRVSQLRSTLAELQQRAQVQRRAAGRSEVESARQNYILLARRIRELRQEYETHLHEARQVNAKAAEFAALKEAFDRAARTSDVIEDRIKEVNLSDSVEAMNVTIMEVAEPARVASYPQRPKVVSLGIALGLVCGLGLVWLRDFLDHRLRSLDEITSVLQLPILGVLPYLGNRYNRVAAGRIVANQPRSAMAEAVRTLRTAIHFGLADGAANVLLVTSPAPADGKSTVASSLAIAMAQADQAVLLIDADFRKPTQHTIFDLVNEVGLSTVMSERKSPDLEILPSGVKSLDVLPCGPLPSNPVELLNNGHFTEMLEDLRTRYDKIIIDSAPVMPVADSRILAAVADATILVLRAGRSSRRPSLAARNELLRVRAQHVGLVVNAAPHHKRGGYGYGYGYSSYSAYGYGQRGYGSAYAELPQDNGRSRIALPNQAEVSAKSD